MNPWNRTWTVRARPLPYISDTGAEIDFSASCVIDIGGFNILIDQCDLHLVAAYRWRAARDRLGHVRVTRQTGKRPQVKNIYLYQEIVQPGEGEWVDHINGNAADNRRCNLRVCRPCENSWNRPPNRNSAIPYKGVARGSKNRFIARIKANGRILRLGSFVSPEGAAAKYDEAAANLFGQFAWLNRDHFPSVATMGSHDHA